ncbi:SpoIIE family protein phosphatase [Streptomyces sp. NPDC059894]|uniref:SpoIIE family protein phosphatase n=1 Tax=unclassified Streptomyces TaxID=2593676 RepID=UPI003666B01F
MKRGQGLLDRHPRTRRRDVPHRRRRLLRIRGRSVTWLVPLVTLVVIAVVDYNTTGEFRIVSWCVFVAAIAAVLCGVWTTALFAVLALLTYVEADRAWPDQYRSGPADFVLVLVGGVLSVLAAAVRVRNERRMLHMRHVAETTRRTVLRPLPPGWGGLDHAAVYLAADADARVGGDFYDIQPGPHGTRVLLGDVQGKGLGAVEAAAALLGTFREAAYHEPDLATVADRLETRMRRHRDHTVALGRDDGDRFATAVLIGFPRGRPERGNERGNDGGNEGGNEGGGPARGEGGGERAPGAAAPTSSSASTASSSATAASTAATAASASIASSSATAVGAVEIVGFGHEAPLAVGPEGVRSLPQGEGLPLGLGELTGGLPHVLRAALAREETLLLVTDGVTEARDAAGAFFPLAADIAAALVGLR